MQRIDATLRETSTCPACGKPREAFVPMAQPGGRTTGRTYRRGDVLDAEDAGLCTCDLASEYERLCHAREAIDLAAADYQCEREDAQPTEKP